MKKQKQQPSVEKKQQLAIEYRPIDALIPYACNASPNFLKFNWLQTSVGLEREAGRV